MSDQRNPLAIIWHACFSAHGRLSSAAFTASAVLVYALFYIGDRMFESPYLYPYLLIGPATVVIQLALICVTARRLHDIDLPGWPAFVIAVPATFSLLARLVFPAWLSLEWTLFGQKLTLDIILYSVVFVLVLVLAFWPGIRGPNRHGPDPRDRGDPQDIF